MRLLHSGRLCYVLDGDVLRCGLSQDLGFTPAARAENIRRVGEMAALFADAGVIVVCAFISPYGASRQAARQKVGAERFVEVYLDVSLERCEARDPKGLYKMARSGQIADFTGVSAPYEPPTAPDVCLDPHGDSVDQCVDRVVRYLIERDLIPA